MTNAAESELVRAFEKSVNSISAALGLEFGLAILTARTDDERNELFNIMVNGGVRLIAGGLLSICKGREDVMAKLLEQMPAVVHEQIDAAEVMAATILAKQETRQ